MEQYTIPGEGGDVFIQCYKKHIRNLVRYLNNMVHDRDIAEELAHDAFVKLYEKKYDLDPDSKKTVNLLITVAKNKALDYMKRRRIEWSKFREKHFEEVTLNETIYQSLEDHYIRSELISTLHDAINDFSDTMRDALVDRLYEEKKACAVSQSRKVSRYRIRQAEKMLQDRLKQRLKEYF